ncbi:MAG: cupin domain-containing protein [Candidatus Izemoplasmatales bacterium]|jgi:quercetin dioxygenase-like cupin family protein
MLGHIDDNLGKPILSSEASKANMKVLVSPKEGWDNHVMRLIEVAPNGYTPKHQHPWEHINFVVGGLGELLIEGKTEAVRPGHYAYIPKDTIHQFRNAGNEPFSFICIVPKEGHK